MAEERIIGHWKLDDAGSTASDSTSNENDGIITGTIATTGVIGQARVFLPSSQDRVEIGDVNLYSFTDQDFTLSAWVRKSGNPGADVGIITKRDDTTNNNSYSLAINSSGYPVFYASSDGSTNTTQVIGANSVTDDNWHLITVTRTGQEYALYVDGAPIDSTSSGTAVIFESSAELAIGNFSASADWDSSFDGYIDDVRIYNYELLPAEVNDLFYDTGYDAFAPEFIPVSPVDGQQLVLVDSDVVFIYSDEHPDLDTLNVSFNTFPVIKNGLAQDGYGVTYEEYSEGFSDGYDGYLVTIEPFTDLPERTTINIEIDSADAYGSFSLFTYSFGTASSVDPPPKFVNFNPLPDSVGHGSSDPITFQFNDGYDIFPDLISGVDTSTLDAVIDGEIAIEGGVIQPGFSGSITPNAFDGVNVSITKDDGWRVGRNLHVNLSGSDNNGSETLFSYVIKMGGGPVVENEYPDGYTEVERTTEISFEIADAIFGVDKEDLQVIIDGNNAVVDGYAESGYSVDFVELEDGYFVTIQPVLLPEFTEIVVDITIENRVGESFNFVYSFQTLDESAPFFVPVTPTADAQRVDPNTQVIFDYLDIHSGPDAYMLDVFFDDVLVVSDGYATDGYSVEFSNIDNGFRVRVIKDTPFAQLDNIAVELYGTDFQGNEGFLEYAFSTDDTLAPVIVNKVPDDGDKHLAAADITFDIHDTGGTGVVPELLSVVLEGTPVITNGVFQAGYSGSIVFSQINGYDGYEVTIDPDDDLTINTFQTLTITVKDGYSNTTVEVIDFEVADEIPPVITNLDPDDGETASLRPFIRFGIHDGIGSGVDPSRTQMTVDGIPAIVDGEIAPNWAGLIDPTSVNGFDGYNIYVRLNDYFEPGTEHFVVIDGYDVAGNHTNFQYSFFTTFDTISPSFENFNPEPGETGVARNTTVFFQFNDFDGYGNKANVQTLNVTIDGNLAISNGTQVNGYLAGITENAFDGYDIVIVLPSSLPEFQWIPITIDGYDTADNFTSFEYQFRTEDLTPPVVEPIDPSPGEINVGPTQDIIFNILDGYSGVDLDTLTVTVGQINAVTNGEIEDGYDASITEIVDGYTVEIAGNNLSELKPVLVQIQVTDLEGNLRQFQYSYTTADVSGPDFDAITPAPFTTDLPNHIDLSFQFIDPLSGPDISTLNVTADSEPLVIGGGAAFGIGLSIAPITNGYQIEIDELVFEEGEEIEVSIDGYDNDGNYSATSFTLTGVGTPPAFIPILPTDSQVSLPVTTPVNFIFADAYGVDLGSLEVFFNGFPAVISGEAIDGYDVFYQEIFDAYGGLDGYSVTIHHEEPFNENETVIVTLFGRDNNGIEGTSEYRFVTISDLLPNFLASPPPFSVDQNENDNVIIYIYDEAGNGIVLDSVDISINSVPIIVDGSFTGADGYSVDIGTEPDGYTFIIEHERFGIFSRVFVDLAATNLDGNSAEFYYYYDTGEKSFPDLIPVDPLAGETDVPRNTNICFDVVDETGVDLKGLTVSINGIPAFQDSSFLPPFDDQDSFIEELTELSFEHFEDLFPIFTPVPAFFPGEFFSETFFDEGSVFDGYILDAYGNPLFVPELVSDGYFTVDGYTDGYDGYDGYILDGYGDDGYDGYTSIRNVGYRFCFDPKVDFRHGSTVTVSVHAADIRGNEGDREYSFTIVSETGPPSFENLSPFPDEEDVELDRILTFDFIDVGSGALLDSLNATIAGRPAIVNGEFQDGYTGSTVYFTRTDGDGYHVEIIPDENWPNFSVINVSLSGADYVDNSALFEYSFRTADELAPIFDDIFPAPGSIDVPTDTAIRFTFNDSTQSGADIDSLDIRILGSLVVIDGNALDGYILEYSENIYDGYDVQLFFPERLPEFTDIDIVLSGADKAGNFGEFEYSWKTADETPPLFDNIRPIFPDSKISITDPIFVDIFEPGSGLDLDSVGVTIDGISVIDSGIVQPNGFVAELTPLIDGYRLYVQSVGPLPHDLNPDVTALWRMDESGVTSVSNATGNSDLDGLAIGAIDVVGKFGNARRFSTSSDRIVIDTDPELALQDFTVEAWINPSSLTSDRTIYTYNPRQTIARNRGVLFKVTSSGALSISLGDGTTTFSTISTGAGTIPTGTYTHVAVIVSQTNSYVTLMVNGAVETTAAYPISAVQYNDDTSGAPSNGTVLIGNRVNPFTGGFTNAFVGDIDDLRVSGAAKSISDVANSFNRSLSVAFSEFAVVPVSLFARDNSGNDGYIDYTFVTLDETPPVFSNFDPSVDSDRIDLNTDVIFDFTDIHSGPDLDSLNVIIDGKSVLQNGVEAIDISALFTPITDGYTVTIDLDYPLPEYKNIIVSLDGYDIDPNQTVFEYQFSTDDISAPDIANEFPEDGAQSVYPFTDISFDIHDFNGSGVQLPTFNVQVDDRNVIIGGEPQEGWDVGIVPTFVDGYDGYSFYIITDRRFALDADIRVFVDGYDAYGNRLLTDYAFHTFADKVAPEIINLDPLPFQTEVPLNSDVTFDIVDGYDVDLSRLDVSIDNIPAIVNGVFQPGFDGPAGAIVSFFTDVKTDGYDGYNIVIDPESDFFYNHQVTVVIDGYDFSDNHVHFEYYFHTIADTEGPIISNRDPGEGEVEVNLESDVAFDITDTISGVDMERLDVHIDSIPAIIDGVFQSGWDGASSGIEVIPDGYRVVLDPDGIFEFDYNQIHVVTIDGYDFADNHTNAVYVFATISDPNPPALSNFSPAPGVDEVPVDTDISFDITDDVSGVDMTRLNVWVNDVPAITDGEIKAPFDDVNAGITPIVDGYSITLDLFVDFGYNELQTIMIDGYDFADNNIFFAYTFLTKVDVDGPTVIPIDPVDSVGDIPRDTDIALRIIDLETGVDFDRFDVTIDNVLAMQDGEFIVGSGFDGPFSQVIQRADGYDITFDSTIIFPASHTVRVVVDGYDFGNNQTHFEYIFTTIDDVGPFVFDFSPIPNSVDANNDPVHIAFGIRDEGAGEVNLRTLKIEISEAIDEPYKIAYEAIEEFQNGWIGTIDNQDDGDGYVIDMTKIDPGITFDLYSVRVTAEDDSGNLSVIDVGKTGGLVDTGTGTVTGALTLEVGEFFLNSNQIEKGDIALLDGVGALVVDGYTDTEIVFDRQIAAGGSLDFRIYRGTFLLQRGIYRPIFAESTSFTTVEVTFSEPTQTTGTTLVPSSYTISGGDYPLNVIAVSTVDQDTFELTLDVPMQPYPVIYTLTVDSIGILSEFGFSVDDGYESVDYPGVIDTIGPRVDSAVNEPFNINVTVVFNEPMLQDSHLTNPNNYLLSHGAYVTQVTAVPTELDRVVLTVENLFGRVDFDVFVVSDKIRDVSGNPIDLEYNHGVVRLEESSAALSGIAGRLKTRNAVRRLHEDSSNWYVASEGGIDVVSKLELENKGFVLDGYGFNAITADTEDVYFGRNDGYEADAYGVRRLSFADLNKDSTLKVQNAFNIHTSPSILSNDVNDLFSVTNASDGLLAVATDLGATLIKNSNVGVHYSSGYDIVSIQMGDGGEILYLANNTLGRVEVFYDAHLDVSDCLVPDAYYSVTTSPEISNSIINQIKVTNNTSIIDSGSNSIYVATNNGLTVIHTDESVPGSSEGGGISLTYGIEGSGATFEIIGGEVDRVVAVDINLQQSQFFVATDDPSHKGGVTTINIPTNTRFQFASDEQGTLASNDLRDLTFKNL